MIAFLTSLEQLQFSVWVRESGSVWAFPMFLFLHTLGMSIVAGGAAITSLALLGFWPKTALKPMEKMIPMMWAAFWLNAVTGTVLLMADATTKLTNPDFGIKMIFVFAGTYFFYRMRTDVFGDPQLDHGPVRRERKHSPGHLWCAGSAPSSPAACWHTSDRSPAWAPAAASKIDANRQPTRKGGDLLLEFGG